MRWPIILGIVGIAATIVGGAAPNYFTNIPQWIWGITFWGGIFAILGAIGSGILSQTIPDITTEGFMSWFKATAAVTWLLAAWEWLQGRSPIEILFLAVSVTLLFAALFEILARRKKRRQPISSNQVQTNTASKQKPTTPSQNIADEDFKTTLTIFIEAHAEPAYREAHNLLHTLCRRLGSHHPLGDFARDLIDGYVLTADRQARTRLSVPFNAERDESYGNSLEMQTRLGRYFAAYQDVSKWIDRCFYFLKRPEDLNSQYRKWRRLDEKFLGHLREIIADPRFHHLKAEVLRVGWGDDHRPEL